MSVNCSMGVTVEWRHDEKKESLVRKLGNERQAEEDCRASSGDTLA